MDMNTNAGQRRSCLRCAKPCMIAPTRNESARMAVEARDRGVCAECIVTGMLKGLTGTDENRRDDRRAACFPSFTRDSLRLPHVQEAVRSVVSASGSSLPVDAIDFEEIIANWDLPLPKQASGGLFW